MVRAFLLFTAVFLLAPTSAQAKMEIPFEGSIDVSQKTLSFTLPLTEEDHIVATLSAASENVIDFELKIDHLKNSLFDIATELNGSIEFVDDPGRGRTIYGQVQSQYTLLNYKPIRDLSGTFRINNNQLFISEMSVGKINTQGSVNLIEPYQTRLQVQIIAMQLEDFLNFWSDQVKPDTVEGVVSGYMQLSGTMNQLGLSGTLSSYDGQVKDKSFDSMVIQFEGAYPKINIANSTVAQSDGFSFNVEGTVDLSQKDQLVRQIKNLERKQIVNQGQSEFEWVIKSVKNQKTTQTSELKYFLRKDQSISEDEDHGTSMLGLEKSIGF